MLLALKEITALVACDCHLFYVLHMIYISAYIFASMCTYKIMICADSVCTYTIVIYADSVTVGMWLCVPLAASGLVY